MGEVNFVAFDSEKGRPTASISGSPVDVADFIAIWMRNDKEASPSPGNWAWSSSGRAGTLRRSDFLRG